MDPSVPAPKKLSTIEWLILFVAVLGFAFDTYELLMMPLIGPRALAELLKVDPTTASGNAAILGWMARINSTSAICGGVFGLLGGYLADKFGRKRILAWSIFLYALSPLAAAFAKTPEQLLILRCMTFIGVCVEFVAAIAWLAELFPNPKQRESIIGYTQAFASVGGLLVAIIYKWIVEHATSLPAIHGEHSAWRYMLITGLIPAIPLMVLLPVLPESPAWKEKKAKGTLKRPGIGELFLPQFRRVTITTTVLFACAYAAAFGAIQMTPQIVPGLAHLPEIPKLRKQIEETQKTGGDVKPLKAQFGQLINQQQKVVANVQLYQETGGLLGRLVLAILATIIVSRVKLLRIFQIPGLIMIPLIFIFPATDNLELFKWGIFIGGLFTIAQFSYWGNYLPRAYPIYLRGTGESFAANVGGRMIGTSAVYFTSMLVSAAWFAQGAPPFARTAYAAAVVGGVAYLIGVIASCWLPEPSEHTEE